MFVLGLIIGVVIGYLIHKRKTEAFLDRLYNLYKDRMHGLCEENYRLSTQLRNKEG